MTIESINKRLGFDFFKKWEEYCNEKSKYGESDDYSDSLLKLLTSEESDYLEQVALSKISQPEL